MQVNALGVAVDGQDECKANANFGGGHSNDEQGEDFGRDLCAIKGTKSDQVDVDRIQDQLDRHEYEHGVTPGQNAINANTEQDRREQ